MSHSLLIVDSDAETYRKVLQQEAIDVEINIAKNVDEALPYLDRTTMLAILAPMIKRELVTGAPRLQWIQALTTGVDAILALADLPESVALSAVKGIHGPQMSELALMQMLTLPRKFPKMLENQQNKKWEKWGQPLLAGKTVGILGVGEIGVALAKRLQAMEMRTIGFSSSPGRAAPGFDAMIGRNHLVEVAPTLDFLVVLVPYASDTHHVVNESVLRAMPKHSYLINIARGNVLDEAALVKVLGEGGIAGAALDVFEQEPLPASSQLWTTPNLLITPHIGGVSDQYARQAAPVLAENLKRFVSGCRHDELRYFVRRDAPTI